MVPKPQTSRPGEQRQRAAMSMAEASATTHRHCCACGQAHTRRQPGPGQLKRHLPKALKGGGGGGGTPQTQEPGCWLTMSACERHSLLRSWPPLQCLPGICVYLWVGLPLSHSPQKKSTMPGAPAKREARQQPVAILTRGWHLIPVLTDT